jgi:hypothetical protein
LGKIFVATSIKREIIRIFESVPNPGRSFSGIHSESTRAPIMRVDVPIERPLFSEMPCASTDHGALPKPD